MERSSAMNNREKNQEHLSDIEFYRQAYEQEKAFIKGGIGAEKESRLRGGWRTQRTKRTTFSFSLTALKTTLFGKRVSRCGRECIGGFGITGVFVISAGQRELRGSCGRRKWKQRRRSFTARQVFHHQRRQKGSRRQNFREW